MRLDEILRTPLVRGHPPTVLEKRTRRIEEALSWGDGRHVVDTLHGGLEVFFLKPGKETFRRKRPNPHDMTPVVGIEGDPLDFKRIWSMMSRIPLVGSMDDFKAFLTLVYRDAYLLDHNDSGGKVRYQPSKPIAGAVDELERRIGGALQPLGVSGMIHFLDILGWNEDVKYHTENGVATFDGKHKFKTGRLNTLLSCIRVPYQLSDFVQHVLSRSNDPSAIDMARVYETLQQFSNSRGTCVPTGDMLLAWLPDYIVRPRS
jgi:hypothetical protein